MKKVPIAAKPQLSAKAADQWVEQRATEARPTKRLTVEVPLDLHRQVKMICARNDFVMADVVRDLLEQYVRDDGVASRST
jgi:hypothetical protein